MAPRNPHNQADHDLLVTLHEQVRALREVDIPALRDNVKLRIEDHETRIRAMEYKQWLWSGAAGVLGAIASLVANKFFQ